MSKPNRIVDSLLIIPYKSGDKSALNLLVKRWNSRLCAHVFRYVRDWAMAKDITQDTWSAILLELYMLRDSDRFRSWALTIASRKSLDALPVNQKIVLKLFYLEKYSLKEISEITKASVNTVKTRLFRAREKIKEQFKR